MESLRLPHMTPEEVDAGFTIEGLEHIRAALDAGTGAILALPHVGGWEVGGSWFVRQGFPLTVVVEALKPPELFTWFADLRRSQGFKVIPLTKSAGISVVRALRANQIVALVSDRDIAGGGVEVEFFGERTTLPGRPGHPGRPLRRPTPAHRRLLQGRRPPRRGPPAAAVDRRRHRRHPGPGPGARGPHPGRPRAVASVSAQLAVRPALGL